MDVFQRSTHSSIRRLDEDHLRVECSMLDLEHSFHLRLTVRVSSGEIEEAKASQTKVPFTRCEGVTGTVSRLVGIRVGRGVIREIHARIGGTRGCAHLLELVDDAVRLIAMMRLGNSAGYWEGKDGRSEEERIAEGMETLRNSCVVYADDAEGCSRPE